MTNDKARDFFSAYYEGSLEPALRQALEQRFRADAVLASDYAAFTETMQELDAMRAEEIEIPQFLSDRIATRLDEVHAKKPVPIFSWLRLVQGGAVTAVAVVAVVLAAQGMGKNGSGERVMEGGVVVPLKVDSDQLQFKYEDGKVVLAYTPTSAKTIVVTSGTTGEELHRFDLDGQDLSSTLTNDLPEAALFDVKVTQDNDHALVAIPGTATTGKRSGSGTVKELLGALADFYRVPVLLQGERTDTPVTWNFQTSEPRTEATSVLRDLGYSVDVRPSGLVVILDH